MPHVDPDRLAARLVNTLHLNLYADDLAGAWLVGSIARGDTSASDSHDIDVLLAFNTAEAFDDYPYRETDTLLIPVHSAEHGTQKRPLDLRLGRGDLAPQEPQHAIDLLGRT